MKRTFLLTLPLALGLAGAVMAHDKANDPMLRLATSSGCMTCHQIEPGGKGPDGLPPIGPAWKEVATR